MRLSAESGYTAGLNSLGAIYEAGQVLPRDLSKAQEYYFAAAALGDTIAMQNLGLLFSSGAGGIPDLAKARMWYQRAAERGAQNAEMHVKHLDETLQQQEGDLEKMGVLSWEKKQQLVDAEALPYQ